MDRHDTRFYPGYGWRQVSFETDTLLTTNGQISQAKLWGNKAAFAAFPFVASWLAHDFFPKDSPVVDALVISLDGVAGAYYTVDAKRNWDQARANIMWNRSVGKP